MFRRNEKHRQVTLFGTVQQLPMGVSKMMDRSWSPAFRRLIFEKIDEGRYGGLYSPLKSRPNFPVNIWVGLEIIKGLFDYTDQELLEQFHFNLLTAYALGQENLGEVTLCERTLYYNRERLLEYEAETGRNLLAEEFEAITDQAIEQLHLDTKTQRMDSSFVGSFIKQMSRLELVVKVLQNFYQDLPEAERNRWVSRLGQYVDDEAEHISYRLKRAEVERHLQEVGALLFELHEAYASDEAVSGLTSYQHVSRVLREQFTLVTKGERTAVEVRPAKEVSASSLQNPADDETTFRRKDGKGHKGYLFNVAETCSPANPIQLLTDLSVHPNVAPDDGILAERLPEIKERTGVEEMIVDANYSGERSEGVCGEHGVSLVPTEVKGRRIPQDEVSLTDFHFDGNRMVSCPAGHSPIEQIDKPEKGRHVVRFAKQQCGCCPHVAGCPVRCRRRFYSLSFSGRQALLAQRRQQLGKEEYRRKCRLRPAIEGTVSQFKQRMHNAKLRVRGLRRVRNSLILIAIAVNFGRLWAYSLRKAFDFGRSVALAGRIVGLLTRKLVAGLDRVALWFTQPHVQQVFGKPESLFLQERHS